MCLPFVCCAGAAFCCAGATCCSCLCAPCAKMGAASKTFARIGYLFFQIFWVIIAIAILFLTKSIVKILPSFLQCPENSGSSTACLGPSAIVRMSFVLACFHLIVLCIILARNTFAQVFHDGCWMIKFMFVFIFFSGSLFIPNSFFLGYMDFARYVSEFFLLAQAMLILIVAYKINERLIINYENEDGLGVSGVVVILLTLLFTAGNITWIVFQYKWYSNCSSSVAIITVTAVFIVGFYGIVFFRTREDASILTSSIVAAYVLYLQWSALASNPDAECNHFIDSNANTTLQIFGGLAFTFISLLIIAATTKKEDK
jgi:hypothetical protein